MPSALTGQLDLARRAVRVGLSGDGVGGWGLIGMMLTIETLDLCLSCKACKAECPSNVDIARLKAEYTRSGIGSVGADEGAGDWACACFEPGWFDVCWVCERGE